MRVYGMYIERHAELPPLFGIFSMYLAKVFYWGSLTIHVSFTDIQIVDAGGSVRILYAVTVHTDSYFLLRRHELKSIKHSTLKPILGIPYLLISLIRETTITDLEPLLNILQFLQLFLKYKLVIP